MRENWEIRKLGDLTTALNGLWVGKKPPFVNIAVIRNTNFTKDCQLDTTDIAYIDAEVKHFSTRKLQCGDIIIEKSGGSDKQPVGRPVLFNIPEGDFSFSNFTSTLRINDQSEILPSFLHKALWAIYRSGKTANLQSKTTGIRNLDFKSYLKLPIPVPPIAEQEKIVAELDCLTNIIGKKKQQLEELDKLAQSIFYDMFGDPMSNRYNPAAIPLSSICTLNPKKSEIKGIDMETRCSFVGMAQVGVNGEIDASDIRSVQEVWTGFSYFKENDVLFAKITPCMENGKGAIARGLHNGIGFGSTEFHVLRPNEKISAEFIFFLLANKDVRRIAEGQMTGSGGQRRVPVSFFSIKTTLPPIDLQNRFALMIAAIEKQKELVKQSIVETETLFNSRMDFWFNN